MQEIFGTDRSGDLQLTDDTKSYCALRALKRVSSDLQAGAPTQPGGLPDISRGLSASDTPGMPSKTNRTPEGCQNRPPIPCRRLNTANLWHPSGVREIRLSGYRGCRRRAPQPPANVWQPSGLRLETASRAALIFGAWSFFGFWAWRFEPGGTTCKARRQASQPCSSLHARAAAFARWFPNPRTRR